MKKCLLFVIVFISNFLLSQNNFVLKIKFDEGYFLSNFMTNNTSNYFVLNVLKKTDSISKLQNNSDYVVILDSLMKKESNIIEQEKASLNQFQKKEFDSLKIEIDNDNFLKLMKKVVEVNFGLEYLENTLSDFEAKNYKIKQTKYNQFSIIFNDIENLERVKNLLHKNKLSFHETFDKADLSNIQNCYLKENEILIKENQLKKEDEFLLISKDYAESFINYHIYQKCCNSKRVTILLNEGKDSDVYTKVYFVKESNELENKLVNSIKAVDLQTKENIDYYADNFFFLSIFLDDLGKKYLNQITSKNIDKALFIAKNIEFIMNVNIKEKMQDGIFINGNLFEENWQDLYELVKFEVFRNSIKIEK